MDNAAANKAYKYQLDESEIFSTLTYSIVGYIFDKGSLAPSWLKIDNSTKTLYGTPVGYSSSQSFPLLLTFTLTAVDTTNGKSTATCFLTVINSAPVIEKDYSMTLCLTLNEYFYYQVPFDKAFIDQDKQELIVSIKLDLT